MIRTCLTIAGRVMLATIFFHAFWKSTPDSPEFQMQMIQFMKNLGLMGAMLMIIANGSGPGSLDNRRTQPVKTRS
jgi:putative oxidoreductase